MANETILFLAMKQYGTNAGQSNHFSNSEDETYVPGTRNKAPGVEDDLKSKSASRAIVGFLYSISRTAKGEYWPLHLGKNTIGKNPNCDIRLLEGTVSDNDVHITIQRKQNTLKAAVFDQGSDNGVLVNGEEIDLELGRLACKSYDVISVGCAYELLLLLIDVNQAGLKVAQNFEAVSANSTNTSSDKEENGYTPNDPGRRKKKVSDGTINENGGQDLDYDPTQM